MSQKLKEARPAAAGKGAAPSNPSPAAPATTSTAPAAVSSAAPATPTAREMLDKVQESVNEEKKRRTRSSISTEKALAIHVANLTGILGRDTVAAQLSDEDKAKVEAAVKASADLNAKTIGPIKAAIAEIEGKLKALFAKSQEPGANFSAISKEAGDLAKQLDKKKASLEQYTKTTA